MTVRAINQRTDRRSSRPEMPAESTRFVIDRYAILLALPFCYISILLPIAAYSDAPAGMSVDLAPNIADRIFWPCYALFALVLALRNRWLVASFVRAPHVRAAVLYMLLAAASVMWAIKPEFVLTRLAGETLILVGFCSVAAVAPQRSNLVRTLFWAFSFAVVVNGLYVASQLPETYLGESVGYRGYFAGKNGLGFFSAFAFLLALTQARGSASRILLSAAIMAGAAALLIVSKSKGALAFAIISPVLAWGILKLREKTRIPPAAVIIACVLVFFATSLMVGNLIGRISWYIYGNPTLSNRTVIWDFVLGMSSIKPWLGWGYRGFWLVSSDFFQSYKAPEWVKVMPHGHNGYLDVIAELGYAGFAILAYFLLKTCNMIGEISRVDFGRAWNLLTLAIFVLLMNLVESSWFRAADPIWLIFLLVMIETGRAWVGLGRRSGAPSPRHISGRGQGQPPSRRLAQAS